MMQKPKKSTLFSLRGFVIYATFGLFFLGLIVLYRHIPQGNHHQDKIPLTDLTQGDKSFAYDPRTEHKEVLPKSSGNRVHHNIATATNTEHYRTIPDHDREDRKVYRAENLNSRDVSAIGSNPAHGHTVNKPNPESVDKTPLLGKDTMLLIICANRPEYLEQTLSLVIKYHPGKNSLPIFISEDGRSNKVAKVIDDARNSFEKTAPGVSFVHKHHPTEGHYPNGYFKLAAHYKWALEQTFSIPTVKRVIILEEDLKISSDFFEYFSATAPILDMDPNLLCVSAWNDNGMKKSVQDPKQLYRSDFFPGLGWMLSRQIWEELAPKWPKAYWDDWLREPKQRLGRHIIRPEVCRTFHIGVRGVSNSQYSEYLNSILLNDHHIAFSELDLSYLSQQNWDNNYLQSVRKAREVSLSNLRAGGVEQLRRARENGEQLRLMYHGFEGGGNSFSALAKWSGAMDNVKAGVPRTAYKGIVTLWKDNVKVHLVPDTFK